MRSVPTGLRRPVVMAVLAAACLLTAGCGSPDADHGTSTTDGAATQDSAAADSGPAAGSDGGAIDVDGLPSDPPAPIDGCTLVSKKSAFVFLGPGTTGPELGVLSTAACEYFNGTHMTHLNITWAWGPENIKYHLDRDDQPPTPVSSLGDKALQHPSSGGYDLVARKGGNIVKISASLDDGAGTEPLQALMREALANVT